MATITSTELGASGRYIDLGTPAALNNLGSCTVLAYCRPDTVGENNFGYLWSKVPSGTVNGPRFYTGASGVFTYGSDGTSGNQGSPYRTSSTSRVPLDTWQHIAATFTAASTNSSEITGYYESGGALVAETTYSASGNSTGSVIDDSARAAVLLNRTGLARAFVGDVAYIAVWDRVLDLTELQTAADDGPLDVPGGLVLLWANQTDLGPNAITPVGRSTYVAGELPPNTNLGGSAATDLVLADAAHSHSADSLSLSTSSVLVVAECLHSHLADNVVLSLAGTENLIVADAVHAHNVDNLSLTADSVLAIASAIHAHTVDSPSLVGDVIISSPERGTLLLSGCSVAPDGTTPTITLANRWASDDNATGSRAMYGAVSGVNGMTPAFRLSRTDVEGTIQTAKKFVYSYDRVTWTELANRSNDASYFYFSHDAAFTSDQVYVASQVPWLNVDTLPWIESLESSGYVSEAPSSAGNGYVFETRSACLNELSEAISAQPLYSFRIGAAGLAPDGTAKRKMVLTGGVHSSEDIGNYCLKGAVEFLVSADAQAAIVRDWFDVLVYPMVGAAGRDGGGTRTDFQSGYVDGDLNRHWHDTTHEALNKHKTAIQTDCGDTVHVLLDFHGMHNSASPYNYVQVGSDLAAWEPAIQTYRAGLNMTNWNTVGTTNYWAHNNKNTDIAVTPEYPFYYASTMADVLDYGADHMRAVSDIAAAGYWYDATLVVADALHAHAADNLTLTMAGSEALVVADANHAHTADSLSLSTSSVLAVADANHAHTADSLSLSTSSVLVVAECLHSHLADNVVLSLAGTENLIVADAVHAHTADNLSLTSQLALSIAEAAHAHTADGIVITSQHVLAVAEALHAHMADNITLSDAPSLNIAEASHAHASDTLSLTSDSLLAIADAAHAHLADNADLTYAAVLAIIEAIHAHVADNVVLNFDLISEIRNILAKDARFTQLRQVAAAFSQNLGKTVEF